MKDILIIAVNEKEISTKKLIASIERRGISFEVFKWSNLSFFQRNIFSENNIIDLGKFGSAFVEIPQYDLNIQKSEKETLTLSYRFNSKFLLLHEILKERDIFSVNQSFFQRNHSFGKIAQAEIFFKKNIPHVPTAYLIDNKIEKVESLLKNLSFHYPIVIKNDYGARGNAVWKVDSSETLREFLSHRRNQDILFQPFIKNSGDYRIIVINGKSIGIMRRIAKAGEWRNNFSQGASVEQHSDETMSAFAENVAKKIGIDAVGIDIIKCDTGYLVLELNFFFGFDGFETIYPNISVSEKILEVLLEHLR